MFAIANTTPCGVAFGEAGSLKKLRQCTNRVAIMSAIANTTMGSRVRGTWTRCAPCMAAPPRRCSPQLIMAALLRSNEWERKRTALHGELGAASTMLAKTYPFPAAYVLRPALSRRSLSANLLIRRGGDNCWTPAHWAAEEGQIHKRRHTGEKPYKCDVEGCDAAFTTHIRCSGGPQAPTPHRRKTVQVRRR